MFVGKAAAETVRKNGAATTDELSNRNSATPLKTCVPKTPDLITRRLLIPDAVANFLLKTPESFALGFLSKPCGPQNAFRLTALTRSLASSSKSEVRRKAGKQESRKESEYETTTPEPGEKSRKKGTVAASMTRTTKVWASNRYR